MSRDDEQETADRGDAPSHEGEKGQARRRARIRRQKRLALERARKARAVLRERKTRLERMGVRYFQKRADRLPSAETVDPVHVLNDDERRSLRRLQRAAIMRAFLLGASSASIVATAMMLMLPLKGSGWDEQIDYWAIVAVVGVVTAIAEVSFMYWDSLRTVHALAHAAGLDVFRDDDDDDERNRVATGLARAALELPNPPDPVGGVNPQRELSRWRIVMITFFYKAKISLTNFIIKALVRRMIGRAGMRTWLAYLGVPVTACWNAGVSYSVLRQARIRVMGPSAAIEYVGAILDREPPLSRAGRLTAMRAVGCSIVSTRDMHPNLRGLLVHLRRRLKVKQERDFDDRDAFIQELRALEHDEQTLILRILYLAAIIDGRVTIAERRLIDDASKACHRAIEPSLVGRLRRHFVAGDPAPRDLLRRIGGPLGAGHGSGWNVAAH